MSIPDHLLERYLLGELSEEERAATEARMQPSDEARLSALKADNDKILERYPPRVMAIEIERKHRAGRTRWMAPTVGSAVVLLGAAAAMAVALQAGPSPTSGLGEAGFQLDPSGVSEGPFGERAKGSARVLVYAKAQPDAPLDDGAAVAEGDTVQLKLSVGSDRYAVLLSVDGRGVLTQHLPARGDEAVQIDSARTFALPGAYTLDDAPRFERFFLVTSASPFEVDAVSHAVGALADEGTAEDAPVQLPEDLHVSDHLLRKVSR